MVLENKEKIRLQVGLRRNSTGSLDISRILANKSPNYLRASVGSCHDFCKYGTKHDFSKVARTPIPRRPPVFPQKRSDPAKKENVETEKSSVGKCGSSLNVKNAIFQVKKKEIGQKIEDKPTSSRHPRELKLKPVKREVSSSLVAQQQSRRQSDVCIRKGSIKNGWSDDGKNANKGSRTLKGSKKVNEVPATRFPAPKVEIRNGQKGFHRSKNKPIKARAKTEPVNVDTLMEKTLYVIETNSEHVGLPAEGKEIQDVSCIDKAIDVVQPSKSSSLSEDRSNSILHKGLHSTGSSSASSSVSTPTCEIDSDGSPRKLKFRKGKVTDKQYDKSGPWRLKFRRGRILGENQTPNAEAGRKNQRTPDGDCLSLETGGGPTKVLLQRRNVEQKRYAESLYNVVIEETARKLTQTKKSKVKALVSAFETVISLEDNKSSGKVKA